MPEPVGIDLGTTNSLICVRRRGEVVTINIDGKATMPSSVCYRSSGEPLVGAQARARRLINPDLYISSAKRWMGDSSVSWNILGKTVTPEMVATLVLSKLKSGAESVLEDHVVDAVITVPAYFTHAQKSATLRAGSAAGLNVVSLLQEPTAAAIAYGLDQQKDQTILVYDLGGGTFDVSILKVEGNSFRNLAVGGDYHLGGDDFDRLLARHILRSQTNLSPVDIQVLDESLNSNTPAIPLVGHLQSARQSLVDNAQDAKVELSFRDEALIEIPDLLGVPVETKVTIGIYNSLISPLISKTIACVAQTIQESGVRADQIDRVILVGGSTRNRLVGECLRRQYREPYKAQRVDEIVAQGAALAASYFYGPEAARKEETEVHLVVGTPFSLGVAAKDANGHYFNSVIIPKNTAVPAEKWKSYLLDTNESGRTLETYVLQGEDLNLRNCVAASKYVCTLPRDASGQVEVEIGFGYDHNGIVTVSVKYAGEIVPIKVVDLPSTWIDEIAAPKKEFDLNSLRLVATPQGFDDVGSVLSSLSLNYTVYKGGDIPECDVFFWNCLSSTAPTPAKIEEYVRMGGSLYLSCMAAKELCSVFGDSVQFVSSGCRTETITAQVMSPDIKKHIGATMTIHYDLAACYRVKSMSSEGEVLLKEGNGQEIIVRVPHGKGQIFFTRFHNYSRMSPQEKHLLQLLIQKQISMHSGVPMEIVTNVVNRVNR